MIKTVAIFCCLLLAGCASGYETITLDADPNVAYLDKAALEALILGVPRLQYPLTRAETLGQLHLTDRRLPSLKSTEAALYENPALFTNEHEAINLTDSEKSGRKYTLLLWYDPSARNLSGDAFIKAKIIDYVEVLVEDDGTGDSPKAKYILQSSRYPYVRLDFPGRTDARK